MRNNWQPNILVLQSIMNKIKDGFIVPDLEKFNTTCENILSPKVVVVSSLANENSQVETGQRDNKKNDKPASSVTFQNNRKNAEALLNSVPRLFGTVFIDAVPAIALIDGGANINCIHPRILAQLDHLQIAYNTFPNNLGQIYTADTEGKLQIDGRVTLTCTLNNNTISITFAIAAKLSDDMILGRPFLHECTKATVEKPPHLILKNDTIVPLSITPDCPRIPIITSSAITLKAHTEKQCIVNLAHKVSGGGHGLVIPRMRYQHIVVGSLNTVPEHRELIVQLENPSGTPIRIPKGVVLGHFEVFPVGSKITEVRVTKEQLLFPTDKSAPYQIHKIQDDGSGIRRAPTSPQADCISAEETLDRTSQTTEAELGADKSLGHGVAPPQLKGLPKVPRQEIPWGMEEGKWTAEQRRMVVRMLSKVRFAFQKHEFDHGFVKNYEVGIDTGSSDPVVMPQYRMEQTKLAAGRKLIREFLIMRIIEPSRSSWRSPLLLVMKPDGSYRMTTDLRGLNKVTKKDQFPLPRIDDMLERLRGVQYMAKLDLKNAFFQILLKPEDREKTAFVFDNALYQFRVLPQGLVHSPANLCRIMYEILRPFAAFAYPYMDDVAIVGQTFEELVHNCEQVFRALGKAGMKISGKKTVIGVREMIFLGHKITPQGIYPDPSKVHNIMEWQKPKTVTQLRQFLGLANYLRKFIRNYAALAHGLTRQTSGERQKPIVWDKEAMESFENLKKALSSEHVLVHPDLSDNAGIFRVRVDASKIAEGGILYQEQNGHNRVIGFASRVFTATERNSYSNPERESHAILWALTHVWRHLLLGRTFEVYSDHKPCLAMRGLSKLTNERMRRWADALSSFDYTAFYAKGETMRDCDALSRMAYIEYDPKRDIHPMDHKNTQGIEEDEVFPPGRVMRISFSEELRKLFPLIPGRSGQAQVGAIPVRDYPTPTPTIIQAQADDDLLHDVRCVVEDRVDDCRIKTRSWQRKIAKLAGMGFIEENILFHMSGLLGRRVWVPEALIPLIMHEMHDAITAGHLGVTRTLQRASVNYYWRGMRRTIQEWVLACPQCQQNNEDPHGRVREPQRVGPYPTRPFERLNMDIVGPLPESIRGHKYVLTVSDLGTRWCEVFPMKDMSAVEVATIFLHQFWLRYGPPKSILTDRGGAFIAEMFKEMCRLMRTQHSLSSAYHPQTNGVTERTHRVFHNILKKTVDFNHSDWDVMIHFAVHAYRTTPHALTGFSPYYLVFGFECTEFLDITMQPNYDPGVENPRTWAQQREQMIARMQTNYAKAWHKIKKMEEPDQDALFVPLREFRTNDEVFIRNFTLGERGQGGGKVRKWRQRFIGPYLVLARLNPTEYKLRSLMNPNDVRYYNVDDIKPKYESAYRSILLGNQLPPVHPTLPSREFHSIETPVERILDSRLVKDTQYYLVKYQGLDDAFNQWLPVDLLNCPNLIDEYVRRVNRQPPYRRHVPRFQPPQNPGVSSMVIQPSPALELYFTDRIQVLVLRQLNKQDKRIRRSS